jgi:hypothetical protein
MVSISTLRLLHEDLLLLEKECHLIEGRTVLPIVQLAVRCLRSEFVEKQHFGASALSAYVSCRALLAALKDVFTLDDLDWLVVQDLHMDVLVALEPVIPTLAREKKMQVRQVAALYETGKRYPVLQRTELHKIVIELVAKLDPDSQKQFIAQVTQSGSVSQYDFLCQLISRWSNDEMVRPIVERFIEDAKACADGARDALLFLCKSRRMSWQTEMLFNSFLSFVAAPATVDLGSLALQMLVSNGSAPAELCNRAHTECLVQSITPANRSQVFRILALLYAKGRIPVDQGFVEQLAEWRDDEMWTLFQSLVERGLFRDSRDAAFAEAVDFAGATEAFVNFLWSVVLFQNKSAISGDVQKGAFVVRTAELDMIELLRRAFLLAEAEGASERFEQVLQVINNVAQQNVYPDWHLSALLESAIEFPP